MDNSLILALIGSVTSLLVAAIGFFAAVRAAKVAAERETARAFTLKRHDAILEPYALTKCIAHINPLSLIKPRA